jgi:N-acetylneuraminate synthase/N,N'-diacetyllegionaminate synthase
MTTFVIAEAGVNHNGLVDLAHLLIDAAADALADAVKFQTFNPDALATAEAPKSVYQERMTGGHESQLEMLRGLTLPRDCYPSLIEHCRKRKVRFMSTPFDEASADFLESLGMGIFKIPSGEVTNLPFLSHLARKKHPVIMSTGMADMAEIAAAMDTLRASGASDITLLHCTTDYPTAPADANLRAMGTMQKAFGVPVGYSDHTTGIEIALAAVALGATVIEKHFTLDRSMPGPDHQASLEPAELGQMVRGIRLVELSLGDGEKVPRASELPNRIVARKSIVSAREIHPDKVIEAADLTARRPGSGLAPGMTNKIIGRRAKLVIPANTLISLDMLV